MTKRSTKRNNNENGRDKGLEELVAIKKLLVLGLLRSGASQAQIASALGVDQSQVSRLFPGGIGVSKATRK